MPCLDVINLVKGQCTVYRPEYFLEKSHNEVDEVIDQLCLSKIFANVSFNFTSCQEICKEYLVTSNQDFPMSVCFC